MNRPDATAEHGLGTRIFHATLASAVIVQLLTSLVMRLPFRGHPGDVFFAVHQYAGYVALALAFAFWLNILLRRKGTSLATLFPWFTKTGRRAVWDDLIRHAMAASEFRLPEHEDPAALPSAVHGLGLLLMTALAVTGAFGMLMLNAGFTDSTLVWLVLDLHGAMGNLAWAYLFGHAGLGLLHHITQTRPLSVMWSLRPSARGLTPDHRPRPAGNRQGHVAQGGNGR